MFACFHFAVWLFCSIIVGFVSGGKFRDVAGCDVFISRISLMARDGFCVKLRSRGFPIYLFINDLQPWSYHVSLLLSVWFSACFCMRFCMLFIYFPNL